MGIRATMTRPFLSSAQFTSHISFPFSPLATLFLLVFILPHFLRLYFSLSLTAHIPALFFFHPISHPYTPHWSTVFSLRSSIRTILYQHNIIIHRTNTKPAQVPRCSSSPHSPVFYLLLTLRPCCSFDGRESCQQITFLFVKSGDRDPNT